MEYLKYKTNTFAPNSFHKIEKILDILFHLIIVLATTYTAHIQDVSFRHYHLSCSTFLYHEVLLKMLRS